MAIPHPIPYQGSKRQLASQILAYLPSTNGHLIEPFVGSAAISLAAAQRWPHLHFILADLHAPLIALWQAILENPNALADQYQTLWEAQTGRERSYYDWVRQQFNLTQKPDYFLYLLARCVKAAVRYNTKGEFNQSPDNRRKGAKPATMRQHIQGASQLLQGRTTLQVGDYRQVVARATPEDVVYLDPPYQGVCGKRDPRYIGGLTYDNFVETLHDLNQRQIAYLVSYDGRTGTKQHGLALPKTLCLTHIELDGGVSSQATLLGRQARTVESLYLSSALHTRLGESPVFSFQKTLWETIP